MRGRLEPKPCPFCGSKPKVEYISGGVSIECIEWAGGCGADTLFGVATQREAIAIWNRRARVVKS